MLTTLAKDLALLAGLLLCVTTAAQECVLVRDGTPMSGIVLPADPQQEETLAANEFVHYVQRMSGAELPAVPRDASGTKVFFGRRDRFPALQVATDLEPEQYSVQIAGDDLYLVGGSAQGVLWAVYGVLHELGCRWYVPGPIGEVVPKRGTVAVAGRPGVDGPDFPYRQLWYSWGGPSDGGPRFAEWLRRNRMAHLYVQHGHNLTNSMPSEASFDRRPELYALRNGTRTKSQVCTTDPEVVGLITDTVNRFFDAHPECLCYSLCPDDNTDFCECERCRALDTGAVTDEGRPIVTDRLITFVNAVAEGIQARHPGKMVSTYAYVNHSKPPVNTPVSPHVAIFFTTSMYCGGHGVGDPACASRMEMKADLEAWARLCPHVYIYEYDPIPGNAEHFWPLFGARAREMPLYREMGIQGLSVEAHCSWATLSPNHWVTAQCLWHAGQDADALLRDFCTGFFGPSAANDMFTFYATLEGALARFAPMIEWGSRDVPDIYRPEVTSACRKALDAAFEAVRASSDQQQGRIVERLHMVDTGFRYLETYLQGRRSMVSGGTYEDIKDASKRCLELIDEMVAANTDYIEVNSCRPSIRSEFWECLAMRYGDNLGLVTTWNAVGPFDNAGQQGHDRAYPPEGKPDLGASYDGLGGPVTWRTISSPRGQGYVDLLHHFSPKDWVTVYALDYVHAERAMDVQFRMGSNDTLKVWLGGTLIWRYDQSRRAQMDEDIVPVHLEPGVTPVLLKVSQTGRDWGFFLRVTDADGNPAQGVRVALQP